MDVLIIYNAKQKSTDHLNLMEWVVLRIQGFCDEIYVGAAAGDENFINMVNNGHLAYYQNVSWGYP